MARSDQKGRHTMSDKKELKAAKIGPWQMLVILMRYQSGETLAALSRIYGISPQTIWRWQKNWGSDTQHVHIARLAAMQQKNFDDADRAVLALKEQVDRTHAILQRVSRQCVGRNVGAVLGEALSERERQRKQNPEAFGGRLARNRRTESIDDDLG